MMNIIDSPEDWALIYLVQLIVPSLAMGALAVHLPRHLNCTRISRFLIGFTATPFLLALWTLILAAVLPGASRYLFFVTPSAFSLILLVVYGRHVPRRLFREWRRARAASVNRVPAYFGYICVGILMVSVSSKLIGNGKTPFIQHDVLAHLSISMPFAEARSISAIPDFTATIDEVTTSQSHTYLYPAFLAQALMTSGSDTPGFPNDHAARAAIQVLVLYFFLAVIALASASGQFGAAALALILLLQVPKLYYMSYYYHRDQFQLIPLMLLATVLSGLSARRLRRRLKVSHLVPCLLFAGFSVAAHTVNIAITPFVVLAWLVWVLLGKAPLGKVTGVLASVGIGALFVGLHYLKSYLDTGNPLGYGFTHYAFLGTPLWEIFRAERGLDDLAGMSLYTRIKDIIGHDGFKLSIQSLLAVPLALVIGSKNVSKKSENGILFFGLLILIGIIPATGVLDFGIIKLSDMFILNPRYIYYWYPFGAVCLSLLFIHLHTKSLRGEKLSLLAYIGLALIVLYISRTIFSRGVPAMVISVIAYYGAHLIPIAAAGIFLVILRLDEQYKWREKTELPKFASVLLVTLVALMLIASMITLIFTVNVRHWLFFAAVFFILCDVCLPWRFRWYESRKLSIYIVPILIAILFFMTTASLRSVGKWKVRNLTEAKGDHVWAIKEALDAISPSDRVLIDRRGTAYYLRNPSIFVFAHPAWPISRAQDSATLRSLLKEHKIRYVLFELKNQARAWRRTFLYHYISDPHNGRFVASEISWMLYEVKNDNEKFKDNATPQ
jgi:hypothetical protein